jgi:hypothetical protein
VLAGRNKVMGLYQKLADDINEVDVIIAGGMLLSLVQTIKSTH